MVLPLLLHVCKCMRSEINRNSFNKKQIVSNKGLNRAPVALAITEQLKHNSNALCIKNWFSHVDYIRNECSVNGCVHRGPYMHTIKLTQISKSCQTQWQRLKIAAANRANENRWKFNFFFFVFWIDFATFNRPVPFNMRFHSIYLLLLFRPMQGPFCMQIRNSNALNKNM